MPLINFKTDFTTLKYGSDRPGGGDSGQPYMQFPIENENTPDSIRKYYEINRTSLDFPIRGGAITQLVEGGIGVVSSTIDRERIQKFFKDAPRGTAFIQKQVGLQLTNPKMQVPNSLTFAGPSLGNAVLPVTNVYNPLNTLAQVQVMGTGAHFNRHGVAPTLYEAPQQTYEYIAGNPRNNTQVTNRLSILRALKLVGDTSFLISSDTVNGIGIDPLLVDRLGISTIQNQLFNYSGGPGSVYGIGFTRIFRTTNTQPVEDVSTGLVYSTMALTYAQLAAQPTPLNRAHPVVHDFRANLTNNGLTSEIMSASYEADSLEVRLGVGNPGVMAIRNNYTDVIPQAIDRLNALSPFYFNASGTNTPWNIETNKADTTDMIKFAFEGVSNDNTTENQAQSVALVFRAFLDGTISDNHTAEYSSFKYLGRGETFRTYQGFDRGISFSFKIFTQTRSEMRPLYQKLNQLISQVYPDYSPTYNIMRGNVVRLTIGDYVYRMPGFLENVNVSIDNSNTPWEILLNAGAGQDDVRQLPHMVTVQCSFKPIMDILPRRQTWLSPYVPLIVNGPGDYLDQNIDNSEPAPPKSVASFDTIGTPTAASLAQTGGTIQGGPKPLLPQRRVPKKGIPKLKPPVKKSKPDPIFKNTPPPYSNNEHLGKGSPISVAQNATLAYLQKKFNTGQ